LPFCDIFFAPIRASSSVVRRLPTPFPADFELMKQWLSSQRWTVDDVTDHSPKLGDDGCVDVQKVYYVLGQDERRSFYHPTSFAEFVGYLQKSSQVPARLLLWDATTSAPSTPDAQGSVRSVVPACDRVDKGLSPLVVHCSLNDTFVIYDFAGAGASARRKATRRAPLYQILRQSAICCCLLDGVLSPVHARALLCLAPATWHLPLLQLNRRPAAAESMGVSV
jgi:hypothetical protein